MEPRSLVPRMRLDELLAELQSRLEAVLATRDRVHALLEAVVSIGSDLGLETVLHRIVEAATTLVDAAYGALGVIGDGKGLIEFIPVGLSEEEIARIEHWPHGLGVLGLLIKDPQPVRLADIAEHPESYGFPKGHPAMRSFLGVPIRVRDEVFGNLYLTEKRGAPEFSEEDEAIVIALATAAGVAIENARLYAESRRREAWLQASSEVTTRLLSGAESGEVLSLMARQAIAMADADLAFLCFPEDDGDTQRVVRAEGLGAEKVADMAMKVSHETLSGQVFLSGEPVLAADLRERFPGSPLIDELPFGPGLGLPLISDSGTRGVLGLAKRSGRLPFTDADVRMLGAFAGQASVALELAEAREDAERLGLLEERDRIARDLHDVVIQRLFAVAMTLTGAARIVERPEAAARVQYAVDELDGTIRQIRSTIFALQAPAEGGRTLRGQAMHLVEAAREQLGFMPGVRLEGVLDSGVPHEVAGHLLAVLREALSNVVRHARATKVDVLVEAKGDEIIVHVEDNGIGIPDQVDRSGLRNMQERADRLGGSLEVGPRDGGGSRLVWQAPLSP